MDIPEIRPAVDAGYGEIELLLHAEQGDPHAVGGRGIYAVCFDPIEEIGAADFIRLVDLDRVALCALLRLGRKHAHFALCFRPIYEMPKPLGLDPVVVCH